MVTEKGSGRVTLLRGPRHGDEVINFFSFFFRGGDFNVKVIAARKGYLYSS